MKILLHAFFRTRWVLLLIFFLLIWAGRLMYLMNTQENMIYGNFDSILKLIRIENSLDRLYHHAIEVAHSENLARAREIYLAIHTEDMAMVETLTQDEVNDPSIFGIITKVDSLIQRLDADTVLPSSNVSVDSFAVAMSDLAEDSQATLTMLQIEISNLRHHITETWVGLASTRDKMFVLGAIFLGLAVVMTIVTGIFQRDIKQQKKTETALRESEAQYSALINQSSDAIYVFQDGRFALINDAFEKLFGFSREEISSPDFDILRIIAPDSRALISERQNKRHRGEALPGHYELTAISKTGRTIDLEVSVTEIMWHGQIAYQGMYHDITKYKKALQELESSQRFIQRIAATVPYILYVYDIIEHRSVYSNRELSGILGYPNQPLNDEFIDAVMHPEDLASVGGYSKQFDHVKDGEIVEYEFRTRDANEQWRWFYSRDTVFTRDSAGRPQQIIGTTLDITERKRAETLLHQHLEQYKAFHEIFESLNRAVKTEDVYRTAIDGASQVLYAECAAIWTFADNQVLCLQGAHGLSDTILQELKKLPAFPWGSPLLYPQWVADFDSASDLLPEWRQMFQDAGAKTCIFFPLASGKEHLAILLLGYKQRQDYSQDRMNSGGMLTENLVTAILRLRTQEALVASEKKFRSIFENVTEGIYQSTVDGKFLTVNPALVRMLGYSSEEEVLALKLPDDLYLYPADRERLAKEVIAKGTLNNVELEFKKKDGSSITVLMNDRAVLDAHGNVLYYEGTLENITEKKRAELEKRQLEEQIMHSQKLESLGVLAGGIAHDFNNLLVGILGNVSLAMLDLPTGSPVRENIRQIELTSLKAADLINQMLAYSGKAKFAVQPVDLTKQIEEMAHLLEVSISKKVTLKYRFSRNLPLIKADPTQINQVILNLITNASDAIGDAIGVITVETSVRDVDMEYLKDAYIGENIAAGKYVFFEVSDTGCGMDETILRRIFEPFFTTKFTGRGLGLAAVLGIVRGHGGVLHVRSTPGLGTSFCVLFPISSEELISLESEPQQSPIPGKGKGVILVVDDEQTVRTVSKRILERYGFDVLLAKNGHEGVAVYAENSHNVSAVLLDMTMPDMDGIETFHRLRDIREGVQVILSSGYSQFEGIPEFSKLGAADFIQKPYTAKSLVEKIIQVTRSSNGHETNG